MIEATSPIQKRLLTDLDATDAALKSINKDSNPAGWANLMNMKGVILMTLNKNKEAGELFEQALTAADDELKIKTYINYAKSSFYAKNSDQALQLLGKAFQLFRIHSRLRLNIYIAHAHMLRGQIFFHSKNDKKALTEFKNAEYYFESETELKGVGLACMEIARIHINNKNMTTAWNYLKKSENCLRKFGDEESMGVAVCKAVALYHAAKEEEAQELLKKTYEAVNEFGMAKYMLYEILDAYLDIRSRSPEFAVNLT